MLWCAESSCFGLCRKAWVCVPSPNKARQGGRCKLSEEMENKWQLICNTTKIFVSQVFLHCWNQVLCGCEKKKKEELRKKGRFWEEKTKGSGEWEGGANRVTFRLREDFQISQTTAESGLSSHVLVRFENVAIFWRRASALGTAWAKLTPPHFSRPHSPAASFLFASSVPRPSRLQPMGYPHPSCLPVSGQDSQIEHPSLFQLETVLLFLFFKKEVSSRVKVPPPWEELCFIVHW